jgi:hypothetical protein
MDNGDGRISHDSINQVVCLKTQASGCIIRLYVLAVKRKCDKRPGRLDVDSEEGSNIFQQRCCIDYGLEIQTPSGLHTEGDAQRRLALLFRFVPLAVLLLQILLLRLPLHAQV